MKKSPAIYSWFFFNQKKIPGCGKLFFIKKKKIKKNKLA
tara:strand:- start:1649 stop:1765 length:117 start_codon:yes stop_codon:yes gene_type:complete